MTIILKTFATIDVDAKFVGFNFLKKNGQHEKHDNFSEMELINKTKEH